MPQIGDHIISGGLRHLPPLGSLCGHVLCGHTFFGALATAALIDIDLPRFIGFGHILFLMAVATSCFVGFGL